jgi:hypothetical protein
MGVSKKLEFEALSCVHTMTRADATEEGNRLFHLTIFIQRGGGEFPTTMCKLVFTGRLSYSY